MTEDGNAGRGSMPRGLFAVGESFRSTALVNGRNGMERMVRLERLERLERVERVERVER